MDFINKLKEIDIAVFRFINTTLRNDLLAALMKFTANDIFLAALVFAGLFILFKAGNKTAKRSVAFSLWALIAANIISSYALKPFFKRPRPPAVLPDVNFLVTMKKLGWAFPSTHAAMAAALAAVLWDDYQAARPLLALFALLVGFFCVYTGGHYPADVLAGYLLGIIVGMIFNKIKNTALTQNSKVKSQK